VHKKIKINDQVVSYQLKSNRRSKHVRLAMYCDGSLVVTKPRFIPVFYIESFLKAQADWIIKRIKKFEQRRNSGLNRLSARDYQKHKSQALSLVTERVRHFNQYYVLSVGKITVRNQRTRWGSCSRLGNLNFNYKIVFLPPPLADYIIVHELCHLAEFNHSKKFWQLVAQQIPLYKMYRRKLKTGHYNI